MNDDQTGIIAEIRLFAGNYAPAGWFLCNGSTLAIMQFQALFSIIGNAFGGDGRTTFKLPDLRGSVPIGVNPDDNTHLPLLQIGQRSGIEGKSLSVSSPTNDPGWTKQGAVGIQYIICFEGVFPSRH